MSNQHQYTSAPVTFFEVNETIDYIEVSVVDESSVVPLDIFEEPSVTMNDVIEPPSVVVNDVIVPLSVTPSTDVFEFFNFETDGHEMDIDFMPEVAANVEVADDSPDEFSMDDDVVTAESEASHNVQLSMLVGETSVVQAMPLPPEQDFFDFRPFSTSSITGDDDLDSVVCSVAAVQERRAAAEQKIAKAAADLAKEEMAATTKRGRKNARTFQKLTSIAEMETLVESLATSGHQTREVKSRVETSRLNKKRRKQLLNYLRSIVPNADDTTTDADVVVKTARYLKFLRSKVSDDVITSFIAQNSAVE